MNRGTATLVDTSFRNNYGNQSGHVYNRSAILLLTLEAHRSASWGEGEREREGGSSSVLTLVLLKKGLS